MAFTHTASCFPYLERITCTVSGGCSSTSSHPTCLLHVCLCPCVGGCLRALRVFPSTPHRLIGESGYCLLLDGRGRTSKKNFPRPESLFVCPQPTKRFQLLQRNLESFETGDPRFRRLCNSPPLWDDGSARLTPLRTMSNAASGERLQPSHALRTGSFPKELTPV